MGTRIGGLSRKPLSSKFAPPPFLEALPPLSNKIIGDFLAFHIAQKSFLGHEKA